jgi:hypothetical protein
VEIAVPLPFKSPVIVVASVNDGTEPPLDVPLNPFAVVTAILDTPPNAPEVAGNVII